VTAINVAIIGAGVRSIAFCKFLADNQDIAKLVAIIDTNSTKAEILNTHFKFNSQITTDYNTIIGQKRIDAVMISTPDYAHVEPAVATLNAHKHVYLEKPLATTLQDCDRIIEAAKSSRSICYLGFNMRHSPVHEKIYHLVRDGVLGKITTIEANEWYYGGKTYFRRWNRLCKFGGGLWLTKACHDFDLITWIAGGHPTSIYATSSLSHYKPIKDAGFRCRDCTLKNSCPDYYDINKPFNNWFEETWREIQLKMEQTGPLTPDICLYNSDKDTFDNGIALINYDNDIRVTYTVNVLAARTTRQMRIVGTKAMIEADTEKSSIAITCRHTNKVTQFDLTNETHGSHGGADYKILSDFFTICRDGGTPRSNLTDGRLAVKMSIAATHSNNIELPVKLSNL
jgi:predicted dehydrogenase